MSSSRPIYSLGLPQQTTKKLTQCGYETLFDLLNTPAESLASDVGISITEAENLIARSKAPTQASNMPSTQAVAAMVRDRKPFSTLSAPIDILLEGGLLPGHILEVSGPPGSPKERIAINIVSSFIASGQEVLFVDMQNMTGLEELHEAKDSDSQLISYIKLHTLLDLMVFMHNLPALLENRTSKVGLLVLNTISFPFHSSNLTNAAKNALLDRIKKTFATLTLTRNLSVVVTSHLATKILNADGTRGHFDTGARGVMVPQLGENAPIYTEANAEVSTTAGEKYLPSGRTFRIVLGADGPASGFATLLSSPRDPQGTNPPSPVFYAFDPDGRMLTRDPF